MWDQRLLSFSFPPSNHLQQLSTHPAMLPLYPLVSFLFIEELSGLYLPDSKDPEKAVCVPSPRHGFWGRRCDRIGLSSGISRAVMLHSINLAPEHSFLNWEEGIQLGGFHRCGPSWTRQHLSGTRGLGAFRKSNPGLARQSSGNQELLLVYARPYVIRELMADVFCRESSQLCRHVLWTLKEAAPGANGSRVSIYAVKGITWHELIGFVDAEKLRYFFSTTLISTIPPLSLLWHLVSD